MDTDRFIVWVKTDDIYKYIADDVKTRFELGRHIMKEFGGLRAKNIAICKTTMMKIKKENDTEECLIKRNLKFQGYKNCAAETEKKINYSEKYKFDVDSLKEDQKELVKNNKLILKTQQKFKSERHNVFTEETDKVPLSSNDDNRMRSIDSIETYTYGMSKDIICKKEKIKPNNI